MRAQRGMTLVETMVGSTVLLLMVAMTSNALVSYGRAYHQYTDRSLRLRQAAKVLEVTCQHLRSAQAIRSPESGVLEHGFACSQQALVFVERGAGLRALDLKDQVLELQTLDLQGHPVDAIRIGQVRNLQIQAQSLGLRHELRLRLDVDGGPPLETAISLRGVQRELSP